MSMYRYRRKKALENVSSTITDLKRDFAACVYLSEAQNPIPPPSPPPPTNCIRVYSKLIHTEKGGGGRVEPERRGNSSHSWVENTNMTGCISSL
jgi:hypothetical protein